MAGNVVAIVLAAGFSERMGEFKPLLPLGGVTVLERCVALFRNAGIDDVRVVTVTGVLSWNRSWRGSGSGSWQTPNTGRGCFPP